MKRISLALLLCVLAVPALAQQKVTTTGWFSDESCARSRAKSGTFTPTNPDCAEDCLKKGIKPVLIAEKEKTIYLVNDSALANEHLAEHVQVTGTLDPKTNVLAIESVKDLGDYVGPACSRPRKK